MRRFLANRAAVVTVGESDSRAKSAGVRFARAFARNPVAAAKRYSAKRSGPVSPRKVRSLSRVPVRSARSSSADSSRRPCRTSAAVLRSVRVSSGFAPIRR
ncbi:MAG: hypothetical protein ACRC7O_17870, partial [Fimbriiglobus sp.]